MSYQSEAALEQQFIEQLNKQGYNPVSIPDYDALLENFKIQFAAFNAAKLDHPLTDKEWERVFNIMLGKSVFQSAKILRDKFVLEREDGTKVYLSFFDADHTVYHPLNTIAPRFVDLYFANDLRLNKFLKPLVNIGAKHDMKVNNSFVLTGIVVFPSIGEQQKLVGFFAKLDRRIEAQRKIVEALKKYKRGVMQRIFRNMSILSPSGFETVQLSAIFKKVSRRNSNGEIKNVITNSAEYGLIPQRDFFDKDIAVDGNTSNYYVIEHGDFVYNPRKSNTAPYGPFNRYEREERGIISPLYTCLVLQADIEPSYLAWYFKSNAWYRYIYDNGSQGVRHDRVSMTDDLLMGIPVIIPSKEAQLKIAKLLDCLESRFQTELSQYESLKSIRVALLQQLFI